MLFHFKKRLMVVLPVNVDEERSKLGKLGRESPTHPESRYRFFRWTGACAGEARGHCRPRRPSPPARRAPASCPARARLCLTRGLPRRRYGWSRSGFAAKQEGQRTDQNRFARAGLAERIFKPFPKSSETESISAKSLTARSSSMGTSGLRNVRRNRTRAGPNFPTSSASSGERRKTRRYRSR